MCLCQYMNQLGISKIKLNVFIDTHVYSVCECVSADKVHRSTQESVAHANDDCIIEIIRETAAHITALCLFILPSSLCFVWDVALAAIVITVKSEGEESHTAAFDNRF